MGVESEAVVEAICNVNRPAKLRWCCMTISCVPYPKSVLIDGLLWSHAFKAAQMLR